MPDPSTQMIGAAGTPPASAPAPQGITPYFVQGQQTQSNPIMDFIHNWATNKLGLAGQEMQQRESMRKQEAEALSNMVVQHPELSANQGFMKSLAKVTDPDFANSLGEFAHVHSLKQATDAQAFSQATGLGGGGGPTSAGSAGGGPAPSSTAGNPDYSDLQSAQDHRKKLQQFQLYHPDMDANTQKLLDETMKQVDADIKRYQDMLDKPKIAGAEAKAKYEAESTPEAIAAQSKVAGAKSGAEARAKLAPDIVAGEVSEAGQKSSAEAAAKGTNTPEATAKKGQDFIKTARANWESNHPSGWFESADSRAKAFAQYANEHGFDPDTGVPSKPTFKAGDIRVKDGVTYQRDGKGVWNPVASK